LVGSEFVVALQERINAKIAGVRLSRAQVAEIVDMVFSGSDGIIAQELAKRDGEVSFAGFGVFETRDLQERNGRNPATGEAIVSAAKRRAAFRPGRNLKTAVETLKPRGAGLDKAGN
jgi:DNA-binding protein HU-beta